MREPVDHSDASQGSLSFLILLALAAGPAHGYAIAKEVEERSGGKHKPTTGSLYRALKRMLDDGLIEHDEEAATSSPDRRRRYFRLTALGERVAALEARRLNELVLVARQRKLLEEPA